MFFEGNENRTLEQHYYSFGVTNTTTEFIYIMNLSGRKVELPLYDK